METTARAGVGSMCMRVRLHAQVPKTCPWRYWEAQCLHSCGPGPFEPGGPHTVASVLTQRAAHALLETGDDGCW